MRRWHVVSLKQLALVAALAIAGFAVAAAPEAAAPRGAQAQALYARYLKLAPLLEHNQFGRALHLDSAQSDTSLTGAVDAVVDHPFTQVQTALRSAPNWCRLLLLHVNTQSCRVALAATGAELKVGMGQKTSGAADLVYPLDFEFRLAADSADYLEARLSAAQGPLSTRDYRLSLKATALGADKTYLQMTYTYGFGFAGRMAMQVYLATVGRNKVGFTLQGPGADGRDGYIGGMRGVVERNAMRYYLAIDAHLASYAAPPEKQFEAALQGWFDAAERYPRQLHDLDRGSYLAKKRSEFARSQN